VLALKVAFPSKVFLLRGNHEFPEQNEHMGKAGFKAACAELFDASCGDGGSDDATDGSDDGEGNSLGNSVYQSIHACFEWLPFACVVADRSVVLFECCGWGLFGFFFWHNVGNCCCLFTLFVSVLCLHGGIGDGRQC
jgi:hypothetical protein